MKYNNIGAGRRSCPTRSYKPSFPGAVPGAPTNMIISKEELIAFKWNEYINLKCTACNKIYKKTKRNILRSINDYKEKSNLYCSSKCRIKSKNIFKQVNCEFCNILFLKKIKNINRTNHNFCSVQCSNKYKSELSKTNKCKKCKIKIKIQRTYCNNCWQIEKYKGKRDINNITLKDVMYGKETHRASVYAKIRGKARTKIKDYTNCCEICGYDKHFEACHIKPISSFPSNTLVSEINDRSNLIGLCRNCHWELDHGLIKF